jgi:hypothetical protein
MRRGVCALVAALVVAAATTASPAAGRAVEGGTGSLDLRSQTTFRTPDQPFAIAVQVRTSEPPAALELAVGVYRRITSGRSEFEQTLDGRFRSRLPVQTVPVALDSLTPDADGVYTLEVTPSVTREGVYPVRVELRERESGDVLDGFVTHVVTVPTAIEADPLDVALVVPLHAPPAIKPDGSAAVPARWSGAIADLAAALTDHPAVPLTVAPTGETLEALATSSRPADRETVSALARAVEHRQVVSGTYVPTDLRALLDAGLTGEVNAQLNRARQVVQRYLGVAPSATLRLVDERLDAAALAAIEAQGVTRVVPTEAVLEPVTLRTTLTASFGMAARRGPLAAAAGDTALGAHFTRDANPVLNASHLLADLAILWFDRPGKADTRRGVVVLPPRDWLPDGRFDEALLAGLGSAPILEAVTLDGFFTSVGRSTIAGRPLVRRFRAPEPATGLNGTATRAARRRLEAFASTVAADNTTVARLDRTLLTSMSSELKPRIRANYLVGVDAQIDRQLGRIEMPQNRSITLTARKGELPITVTNHLPYPVKVIVELSSDTLEFPGAARREVQLTRENTTQTFAVRAQGSGSFPVVVRVLSPQGELLVAESRFTVRSTAVSGVGVALSVGALAFLLLWWASHLRSRRRDRPAVLATT